MKLSELKPNMIFKVTGGEGGYWIYKGRNIDNFICEGCHKERLCTHEFLHYTSLDDLRNHFGRFDYNSQFGSECVKSFIEEFSLLVEKEAKE